jgi:hypothetical protein
MRRLSPGLRILLRCAALSPDERVAMALLSGAIGDDEDIVDLLATPTMPPHARVAVLLLLDVACERGLASCLAAYPDAGLDHDILDDALAAALGADGAFLVFRSADGHLAILPRALDGYLRPGRDAPLATVTESYECPDARHDARVVTFYRSEPTP